MILLLVCGLVGFVLAGPWGAVLGVVVGLVLDDMVQS